MSEKKTECDEVPNVVEAGPCEHGCTEATGVLTLPGRRFCSDACAECESGGEPCSDECAASPRCVCAECEAGPAHRPPPQTRHTEAARAWYAAEMAEQPADCACYESHIAALAALLAKVEWDAVERAMRITTTCLQALDCGDKALLAVPDQHLLFDRDEYADDGSNT